MDPPTKHRIEHPYESKASIILDNSGVDMLTIHQIKSLIIES